MSAAALEQPALVLNRHWVPVHMTTARHALMLLYQSVARAVNPTDLSLHAFQTWTDLRMPDMDGVELTRRISERWPDLPVLMCTAHATIETAVEAMKHGARAVLTKPVSVDSIEHQLGRIQRETRLEAENRYLRTEARGATPESIVAESVASSSFQARASKANSRSTARRIE